MSKQKNYNMELLRFFFALCICLHHFHMYDAALPFGGGYLAVDFFLIVSGYFLACHFVGKDSFREVQKVRCKQQMGIFLKRKYFRLWGEYFYAFLCACILSKIVLSKQMISDVRIFVQEALMWDIPYTDVAKHINPPDWYCAYLLIGLLLAFTVLTVCKKRVQCFITVIVSFTGYIFLCIYSGNLNIFPRYSFSCILTWLRVISGVFLGTFLTEFVSWIKNSGRYKKVPHVLWESLEILLLLFCAYMLLWNTAYNRKDFILIPVYCLIIVVCELNGYREMPEWRKRGSEYLGSLSYTLYLNHYIVAEIFTRFQLFAELDWKVYTIIYLICVFVFSNIQYIIMKILKCLVKSVSDRLFYLVEHKRKNHAV